MNPDKTPAGVPQRLRASHIVAAISLVAVLDVYIMLVSAPVLEGLNGGRTIFDLRFGYSPETARRLIAGFGENGWRAYALWHTAPDTLLAVAECAALVMICLRATRPGGRFSVRMRPELRAAVIAAPVAQAVFDIAENGLVLGMLAQGAGAEGWLIKAASSATMLKWISAAFSLTIAFSLGGYALLKWIRRRQG